MILVMFTYLESMSSVDVQKSSVKENRRIALQKTPPYVCDCWALMVGDASQGARATQKPMNVRVSDLYVLPFCRSTRQVPLRRNTKGA